MPAETITFYSYKGGTGRSLVVSHVANYLSSFGKRVVAIDFDLEAPGLHFKLRLNDKNAVVEPRRGLLDLLFESLKSGTPLPASLAEYVPVILGDSGSGGWIRLLAAGNTDSNDYWGRLAQINWHDTFYAADGLGVPFFLELVRRVESEFEPDYILIDSRTGVTEIGGIATSILPDRLVCLFTNSLESLNGTRNVLRSVIMAPRLPSKARIDILPILTRIPEVGSETEAQLTESALTYLNEAADRPEATLALEEIFVLHSEPSLQVREKLLTTGDGADAEPPLLRDYVRLFSRLVAPEVVAPHIDRLIENALRRVIDDPDGVQKDLEALARTYPHQASLRALLKFYRLRQASPQLILKTAARLFRLTRDARDPYLLEVVNTYVKTGKLDAKDAEIVELVDVAWRETNDSDLGFALINVYGNKTRAREIILSLLDESRSFPSTQFTTLINHAIQHGVANVIVAHVSRFADEYAQAPQVLTALVRLLLDHRSAAEAKQFLERTSMDWEALGREDPVLRVRLASGLGESQARDAAADAAIRRFVGSHDPRPLAEIGHIYSMAGDAERFIGLLRVHAPDHFIDDVREFMRRLRER